MTIRDGTRPAITSHAAPERLREVTPKPSRSSPPADDPDLPAVQRIWGGDPSAYAEIVRRHEAVLRKVVMGIVADEHLAEDVLQDVFLTAYRKLKSFRGDGYFGGWLYRIAVRTAQRARRRWKPWWPMPSAILEKDRPLFQADAPEQTESWRETLARLQRLPVRQRAALVLHVVEEKTYHEVADLLGCSMGTVGSLIHRARKRLLRDARPPRSDSTMVNDLGLEKLTP